MSKIILDNGLTVLHQNSSDNPLVTIQIFFRAGYAGEPATLAGITNLMGVLCSQETTTRDSRQLARELEDRGAFSSSEVDADYATLSVSLPSAHFDEGFALLADMALHPAFSAYEMEKERANALAALRSRQDQIFKVADDALRGVLFSSHPYARTPLGSEETLAALTRDDLARWHRDFIVPGAMIVVVVGDVTLDAARGAAEKYFGVLPRQERQVTGPPALVYARPQDRHIAGSKFEQAYVMAALPAPGLGDPSFVTLKFINALLGGRMSGRLFSILREQKSLAYEVSSFYPTRLLGSRFVVYLGLDAANIEIARAGIRGILRDLADEPVPDAEIADTKNYLRGAFLMDRQTIARQAWYLGYWEALGRGFDYADRYLEALMAVSAKDIQRAAREFLTADPVTAVITPGAR